MIDKKTLISLLSKITHGQKKVAAKQTIHPRREWFVGLLLFLVVTLCGGLFSLYNFTRFSDIHLTLHGSEQAVESYKQQTVKKALSMFGEKRKKFEALESEGRVVGSSQTEEQNVPAVEEGTEPEVVEAPATTEEDIETTQVVPESPETTEVLQATTTPRLEVF